MIDQDAGGETPSKVIQRDGVDNVVWVKPLRVGPDVHLFANIREHCERRAGNGEADREWLTRREYK